MTGSTPSSDALPSRLERVLVPLTHLSAAAILCAALVRLVSTHSRFPWWELDPSRQPVPETTLLPSQALTLDLVVWIASILGVGACVMLGRPLRWVTGILAAVGAAGAMTTYIFMGSRFGSGPDDAVVASAWSSSIIGAWAMTHLASDPAIRRHVFTILAGASWVLAAKGAYQVFIEHPATVAHYKANTEAMLAAQGIEPGSAGAREFERRLLQPEATGWVGMSNAHASILAAMLPMTLAFAWSAWADVRAKRLSSGVAGVLSLGAIAAVGGLAMTFSKGGIIAGVLAVTVMLTALWTARRGSAGEQPPALDPMSRLQGGDSPKQRRGLPKPAMTLAALAIILPLLALAAIAARGWAGESLGERSLLFRSQYLVGATRIVADTFPWGVGPGGFKAAYALHKPPLSPESVESPHSILFDWLACLGVFGATWCALLFGWLWQSGCHAHARVSTASTLQAPEEHAQARMSSPTIWQPAWLLVPLAACTFAWIRESPTVAPDEWLVRVLAVGAWVATILCAARLSMHRAVPAAVLAAAVALATHGQIELTPVLPATAATVFLQIALAAAGGSSAPARANAARGWGLRAVLLVPLVLLIPLASANDTVRRRVTAWERHLGAAAEMVEPLARIRALLPEIGDSPAARRELEGVLQPFAPPDVRLEASARIALAMTACVKRGDEQLRRAWESRPEMQRVDDAALRLILGVTADLQSLGQTEAAQNLAKMASERIAWMDARPYNWTKRGGGAASVAGANEAIHRINPGKDNHFLRRALELWQEASTLDPTALTPVLRQIDLYEALDQPEQAAAAARRALELNENLRLDPLKQLSDAQRRPLESIAATGHSAASPRPETTSPGSK